MKIKDRFFLFFFILFSLIIVIEGGIPSSGSSSQSKVLAWLFDRGPKTATVVDPSSVSLEGENTLLIGKTNTYSLVFSPSDTTDKRVSYSVTGDTEAVSLNQDGTLTGLKPGFVTLKAVSSFDSSLSSSLNIAVRKEPLTSLSLSLSNQGQVIKGMTDIISVSSNLEKTDYADLVFHSSDTDVASVDEKGVIRTYKIGSSSITAASIDNPSIVSNAATLNVVEGTLVDTVSMSYEGSKELYVGSSLPFAIKFNSDASDKNISVVTDNQNVSYENGSFVGLKEGKTIVNVTSLASKEVTLSFSLTVNEVKADSLKLSEASIQYGKTASIKYSLSSKTGLPVTCDEVVFSSSNTAIASIDSKGLLVGYMKGNVEISAYWKEDSTVFDKVTVSITSVDGDTFDNINYWTRKIIGHFSLFFVTGIFGILFSIDVLFKDRKHRLLIVSSVNAVYAFLLATLSEVCQLFAKGRGPSFIDVLIDSSGYVFGILIVVLIFVIIQKKKKKKAVAEEQKK